MVDPVFGYAALGVVLIATAAFLYLHRTPTHDDTLDDEPACDAASCPHSPAEWRSAATPEGFFDATLDESLDEDDSDDDLPPLPDPVRGGDGRLHQPIDAAWVVGLLDDAVGYLLNDVKMQDISVGGFDAISNTLDTIDDARRYLVAAMAAGKALLEAK